MIVVSTEKDFSFDVKSIRIGCEGRMLAYGFPWPEMLRCDQYPLENDLCIGMRSEENTGTDCSN